jgi:nucleotide-binding universal stress UspA family protein
MGKILCATRGGEASYRTQDAAIALAKARHQDILYLYVVNLGFLGNTSHAIREDIVETEMEKLGAFLLEMARMRTEAQGVTATTVARHGDPREEIRAAAHEYDVDLVVLGRPADGGRYSQQELEDFALQLQAETGVEVLVL